MIKGFSKRLIGIAAVAALVCSICSSWALIDRPVKAAPGDSREGSSNLIVYFTLGRNAHYPDGIQASSAASLTLDGAELVGSTEYMARRIQEAVGGDLYSLKTLEPYPADFDAVVDQNHDERDRSFLPELESLDLDLSKYSRVFIGYPVWAATAPRAIFSFLASYDLSGKTVIPFCSHDGYGAGSSYRDIARALGDQGAPLQGLAVEASDVPSSDGAIAQWLQNLGLTPQEAALDPSGEPQGVALSITVGGHVLEGRLYDTPLAQEICQYFPLTLSMGGYGGREYYGSVDFYPQEENLQGGRQSFEDGHITYCQAHHNMAIFYAQTDNPNLSVDVFPIGKVTSDLAVFQDLPRRVEVTFALAGQ